MARIAPIIFGSDRIPVARTGDTGPGQLPVPAVEAGEVAARLVNAGY